MSIINIREFTILTNPNIKVIFERCMVPKTKFQFSVIDETLFEYYILIMKKYNLLRSYITIQDNKIIPTTNEIAGINKLFGMLTIEKFESVSDSLISFIIQLFNPLNSEWEPYLNKYINTFFEKCEQLIKSEKSIQAFHIFYKLLKQYIKEIEGYYFIIDIRDYLTHEEINVESSFWSKLKADSTLSILSGHRNSVNPSSKKEESYLLEIENYKTKEIKSVRIQRKLKISDISKIISYREKLPISKLNIMLKENFRNLIDLNQRNEINQIARKGKISVIFKIIEYKCDVVLLPSRLYSSSQSNFRPLILLLESIPEIRYELSEFLYKLPRCKRIIEKYSKLEMNCDNNIVLSWNNYLKYMDTYSSFFFHLISFENLIYNSLPTKHIDVLNNNENTYADDFISHNGFDYLLLFISNSRIDLNNIYMNIRCLQISLKLLLILTDIQVKSKNNNFVSKKSEYSIMIIKTCDKYINKFLYEGLVDQFESKINNCLCRLFVLLNNLQQNSEIPEEVKLITESIFSSKCPLI